MASRAKRARIEDTIMKAILDHILADESSVEDLETEADGISSGEESDLNRELCQERGGE